MRKEETLSLNFVWQPFVKVFQKKTQKYFLNNQQQINPPNQGIAKTGRVTKK
jgi:hypothetical protein